MKKILAMALCLVMCALALVGCADDEIGSYLPNYDGLVNNNEREAMELDFYIVVGEGTDSNAIVTVERMINSYLETLLNTTLDIHYVTEQEYNTVVLADSKKTGDDRADIVLINSVGLFNDMMDEHLLANLTDFYKLEKFGILNRRINEDLLKASKVVSQRIDLSNNPYNVSYYYSVPNNRVLGQYEYVVIKNDAAEYLLYSASKLSAMTTYESTQTLRDELVQAGYDADECVKLVSGKYEDKALYESQGYTCNIAKYPTIDVNEAFYSAFSIVADETDKSYLDVKDKPASSTEKPKTPEYYARYERCMEVIYALNTDATFRNLLQYGVKNTNYQVKDDGTLVRAGLGENAYYMNILYTGDVFLADYCEEIGWTAAAAANGNKQNAQTVLYTPADDDSQG